ncbi:ceramide synthase [Pezoporus flaviventris]|uniref:ceramide synthase n=1 Tax=Pezoporus flaviventris TaxID=889875 RepID=UPI002AB0A7BD|nr:ceramide synthase [Pezoporus flaviventris]
MASTAGFIIASSCQHVIDDEHWLAEAYPAFAVPYFLYDVYAMFLCHRHRACVKGHEAAPAPPPRAAAVAFLRREPLLVLHHVTMVLVCFPVACLWREGKGDFFLGCLLLAELSTPCVCLGKVLILLGRQRSLLHRLNAAALALTFLPCRLLLFPYLYWAYGRQRGLPLLRVPGALPHGANAAAAALLAPQIYWYGLICRAAARLLWGGRGEGALEGHRAGTQSGTQSGTQRGSH